MNLRILFTSFLLAILSLGTLSAQVPKPEDVFGFRVGADHKLAEYHQMMEYWKKLDAASDRVQMIEIGKSVFKRPIMLLFISSEANLKQLEKWRGISESLARARIEPSLARQYAKEGKAVVWFDGGMHASERAHAQMTSELAYKIASEESEEMQKIRENVVTLVCPVINPDGVKIMADWHKRVLGTAFETTNPPILYQEYVGHDNNRDWFMNNMPETRAATTVLYNQWYPQIVHNHHQTSPAWARIFIPPFRTPVNQRIHPGVTTSVNLVGTAMAQRFAMEKMPGVIADVSFSMWWNGGMRTAPYFHNMIGILTETAHATPTPRYYDPAKLPKSIGGKLTDGSEIFYPYVWKGGESHFRDAVDYMLTASMAVLDLAADKKDEFLFNIYQMGRDAIENKEEAFAYIIPTDQWDAGEARNLTNILRQGGVEAHIAQSAFKANDKNFPEGSVIFYGAQAFRPFLVDLMEKQMHPDLYDYPGGPPVPPYDVAGWTLPMQMGVTVERVDSAFAANVKTLEGFLPIRTVKTAPGATFGFAFSNRQNNAYRLVNELQRKGLDISVVADSFSNVPAGSFLVSGKGVESLTIASAKENGIDLIALGSAPSAQTMKLAKIKIGIYKSWQANMDEGWTRWMLQEYGFELDTLHNEDIIGKDLSKYQAIILPDQGEESILHGYRPGAMPDQYCGGIGPEGVASLSKYIRNGGTLIAFDEATDLAINQLGLPVRNTLLRVSERQFFIPGSLVRAKIEPKHRLTWGLPQELSTSFQRSRAFEIIVPSRTGEGGVEKIAEPAKPKASIAVKYADKNLLMSGWALGADQYLKNKAALVEVEYGTGKVVLFGFRPQFRGQPRGTYKLIFNAIHQAAEVK